MSKKLPVIAIIGRPNVGKSSLFNRLIGQRKAIVANEPGTTRDKLQTTLEWREHNFWLIDTAGLMAAESELEASVQEQVDEAMAAADILLLVVDGTTIPTREDKAVAKRALKSRKPVILAVNKLDDPGRKVPAEFKKLGVTAMIAASAIHGRGSSDLLDAIVAQIPQKQPQETPVMKLALLGRPNVGKSSLFNALSGRKNAVTSAESGTTRDVNQLEITYHKEKIELFDTAGIRKSGKIRPGIERFSFFRTVNAIQEADICIVLIDATEPATALDQKIAGMVARAGKGLIIALNKWDLVKDEPETVDLINRKLGHDFQFVWWAPVVYTSAESGHNVPKLLEIADEIKERRQQQVSTSKLNQILAEAVAHHPPAAYKNKHPKLSYITQTDTNPPEFTIFGTYIDFIHWSYRRFLETNLRNALELGGTPIWVSFRKKQADERPPKS